MKVGIGVVSSLAEGGAFVASEEERSYMTGALRVPAWLRDEERYGDEVISVGDRVLYVEGVDGFGRVLGKA